ncbi:MAG: nucleoside kinase, partial [Clostridiales bacterium]|nr:nucleoside kinase [Clostridiales bacterium]
PNILQNIDRVNKFKIYISPTTDLNIDNHNRIPTTDNRLLRRMIRDARTRGNTAEDTLKSWNLVRRGEERFIFPYQDEADAMLNTALIYELGVLHVYALPLLYSVDINSIYYDEAKRLINLLKNILPIPSDEIPRDSIIREFIGGSCYEVQ